MNRDCSNYRLEVFEKKTKLEDKEFLQTVKIFSLDEKDNVLDEKEMVLIPASYIYELISTGKEIYFENAYIQDFSLSDFKKKNNLSTSAIIRLKKWQTINCLFDGAQEIDFSNAYFTDTANFKSCYFLKDTNFSFTQFETYKPNFEYSFFYSGNFNLSESKICAGDLSFKNAIFREGTKDFQNTEFGDGSVLFMNTNFGKGDVLFSGAKFGEGRKSFKVATFGEGRKDFNFVKWGDGDVLFERTNFGDGTVNFRSTEFGKGKKEFLNAQFGKGQKNFIHTIFNDGAISFKNVDFGSGKVSFKLAELGNSKKDFHFARFGKGDIIFDRTNFGNESLDFRAVDFGSGRLAFNRCRFGSGDITFEASELKNAHCTFNNCSFGQGFLNFQTLNFKTSDLIVINSEFLNNKISFKHSNIKQLILSECSLPAYFDLRMESCKKLDLSDTIVEGILDIMPHDFDAKIENINLSGMRLLGRIYLDWHKSKVKDFIYNQDTNYQTKAEEFRILKENYSAIGEYDAEDLAYVEFKRAESRALFNQNKKNKKLWEKFKAYIRFYTGDIIFDKVGKYATDPVRVMISMVVVYLLFTLLYLLLPFVTDTSIVSSLFDEGDPRNLSIIQRALYHSAITFLTIGYGDYYPHGVDRWLSAIEGFVGLFLMSYFTVAFVRKILR